MTQIKHLFFLGALLLLVSCGQEKSENNSANSESQNSEQSDVAKAMKEGVKMFSNLDELEKEIDAEEEKRSNHKLQGYFKGSINGKEIEVRDWQPAVSRGSLFDQKASFNLFIDEEKGETLSVILNGKNLHDGKIKTNYSATRVPYKVMDEAFMERFNTGFASIQYLNDETGEEWISADGSVVLEQVSANQLKVRWKGEAFLGDWQEKNFAPFEGEINVEFNFISDLRNL